MTRQTAIQTQQQSLTASPLSSSILQRKCASCGQHTIAGSRCAECENKRSLLQCRSANQAEPSEVPPIMHEVLRSPGQPLNPDTRDFMESRFGHDFSRVRVHTDVRAAESAGVVGALAYTWRHDIVVAQGQYQPGQPQGSQLLAHELAHVVQQDGLAVGMPRTIMPVGDFRESAADAAAHTVSLGGTTRVASAGSALLSLLRDSRLESLLANFAQVARQAPTPLNDQRRVELIFSHFSGVNLRDPDNLSPVADAVARYFPEQTLFLFLQQIEADVTTARIAATEEQMQEHIRMLQVQRGSAWGTMTPLPVTEAITGNIARPLTQIGTSASSFFEGVIDGLSGSGSNALVNTLAERLLSATTLTAVTPVVFAAGAVVGIGQDFWHAIRGLWNLITDFPGMLEKFGQLFATITSPSGPALSRLMGRYIGQEWRSQLIQMAGFNVFKFTYELGRLIGPTVAYAVLAILGVTTEAVISAAATRFAGLFQQFPALIRITERIGSHLPRRRPSPLAGATEAEIDAAIETMTSPRVTGGLKRPRIDDRAVPTNQRRRLDIEDIPRQTGETMRAALDRVRRIIGRKISDIPAVRTAWEQARAHVLQTRTLDASNYEELYNLTRNRFWQEVRNNPAARQYFTDAGFTFPSNNTTAPILQGVPSGIPVTETRVSLDHLAEKAIGDNWRISLDADNLQMEFAMPNTYREIIQSRHPTNRVIPN